MSLVLGGGRSDGRTVNRLHNTSMFALIWQRSLPRPGVAPLRWGARAVSIRVLVTYEMRASQPCTARMCAVTQRGEPACHTRPSSGWEWGMPHYVAGECKFRHLRFSQSTSNRSILILGQPQVNVIASRWFVGGGEAPLSFDQTCAQSWTKHCPKLAQHPINARCDHINRAYIAPQDRMPTHLASASVHGAKAYTKDMSAYSASDNLCRYCRLLPAACSARGTS